MIIEFGQNDSFGPQTLGRIYFKASRNEKRHSTPIKTTKYNKEQLRHK